jgi:hypothetical protein
MMVLKILLLIVIELLYIILENYFVFEGIDLIKEQTQLLLYTIELIIFLSYVEWEDDLLRVLLIMI